jgi:hypothetical protein
MNDELRRRPVGRVQCGRPLLPIRRFFPELAAMVMNGKVLPQSATVITTPL